MFMRAEWGYPDIGVGIADTPSAGHELIMLDYRGCGSRGEPRVVHVNQEAGYAITDVAPDFATFIRGLVSEDEFDDSHEMFEADLDRVRQEACPRCCATPWTPRTWRTARRSSGGWASGSCGTRATSLCMPIRTQG
ncbi:hypothetical protein ACFQX7_28220 [Luedemannella flava]